MEVCIVLLGAVVYISVFTLAITLFAEICIYVQAIFYELASMFNRIDKIVQVENDINRIKHIDIHIVKVIKLHMTVKRYTKKNSGANGYCNPNHCLLFFRISEEIVDCMSGSLFFQILNGVGMLSMALFQVDSVSKKKKIVLLQIAF